MTDISGRLLHVVDGRAEWPWATLLSRAGSRLESHEAILASTGLLRDGWLSVSFEEWCDLGTPPQNEDPEQLEAWSVLQEVLFDAVLQGVQTIEIRSVGYVGAPGASLQAIVDGSDLSRLFRFDEEASGPFPSPPVARALTLLRDAGDTRPAQLARWARLRAHLELTARCLPIRVRLSFDPHLDELNVRTPDRFSLSWKPGPSERIASLELSESRPEGAKKLDLASFDPGSGVITAAAQEPLLLPPVVAEVARQALRRQRQLISKVSEEIADPARMLPEGLDIDANIDLSHYADRVIGFERVVRKDRPLIHDSSGIDWHALGDEHAFLRLPFREEQGGERRLVEFRTVEDARSVLEDVDREMREPPTAARTITISGLPILPTEELRNTLDRAIKLRGEALLHEAGHKAESTARGTLAAVLEERDAAGPQPDGPEVDMSGVPFAELGRLLKPAVELKEHQRRGVAWLWQHAERDEPGVLLADDMGLGKTLQVAAFIALRLARGLSGPALVVAPTILLQTWLGECERFFLPDVFEPICVLHGDGLRRHRSAGGIDVAALSRFRLVLTNYETVGAYQTSLLKVPFSFVVFDEVQALKNETTLRSRGAQGLKREMAIGMTGTPVENKLSDLWAIFEGLQQRADRRAFGPRSQFEAQYERRGPEGIQDVRKRLSFPSQRSIVLRREKAQALRELPPKRHHEIRVAMTPWQFELERLVAREMKAKGAFGVLDKLRKLYQHPALVVAGDQLALRPATALDESPKTARLVTLLQEIRDKREKALVFTQFVSMQELLRQVLIKELGLPRINIINGDPRRRGLAQQVIDDFSGSVGFDVLILSPLAAGVGLTITAANHVIHYGRWWNPAKEDQATDRAHRIGQTKEVNVYYLLLHHPGNTEGGFDVKLHRLLSAKASVAREFLAPANDEALERDLEAALLESPTP